MTLANLWRRWFENEPVPEPPVRSFHLGLDFGTSAAKLVLRDRGAPSDRALIVPDPLAGEARDWNRIPTLVVCDQANLHFGRDAQARIRRPGAVAYESIKMRALFRDSWPPFPRALPAGLSPDDLAVLELVYLIQICLAFAKEAVPAQIVRPRLTVTMGAPVAVVGDDVRRDHAVRLLRTAHAAIGFKCPDLRAGITPAEARDLLQAAHAKIDGTSLRGDARDWVRSEAEAALLWFFRSPAVRPGLYGAIDVGAGSVDASFFRIFENWDQEWRPEGLAFYSATTRAVGMDMLTRRLAERHGLATLAEARGREEQLAAGAADLRLSLADDCDRIVEVRNAAFQLAYPKERLQSRWEGCRQFLVGGGARFPGVVAGMQSSVTPNFRPMAFAHAGRPPDLASLAPRDIGHEIDSLLVAYGLSYQGMEVPVVDEPDTVLPIVRRFPAMGTPRDVDELYPD